MEQQQKFYPVGIQTFSEIIGKNYLYIDKTVREYVEYSVVQIRRNLWSTGWGSNVE